MVSSASSVSSTASISPVTTTTTPNKKQLIIIQQQHEQQKQQQQKPQKLINNSHINNSFTNMCQDQFLFFSMDQKGHCGYERDNNVYAHVTLASTINQDIPIYSNQIEQELFDTYFTYVHPFFPILDRYYTLQSFRFDNNSIPCSLKWAVMATALSHFSNRLEDSNQIATIYYQHAIQQLDHSSYSISTVQTLLLLYKYQEMMTPVGQPIHNSALGYLKQAQSILHHLKQQRTTEQQQQWTTNDEFICRLEWILFIILSTSNISDKRWKNMLEYSTTPSKLPALTDTEQYDRIELNTFCNLIHLVNITLLYSQTISLISDQSTLFSFSPNNEEQFNKLATGLKVWKNTLPAQMSAQLDDASASAASSTTTIDNNNNNSYKLPSFTAYISLIYDILHLLISIHQSSQQHTLSKKALSICIRAHSFTIGDVQPPQFSRLASIHGSRLVSFGLCLALQTQSYYQHMHQSSSQESFYACCSLIFKVLGQVSLSPQLYMTIQTFHTQIESKKQLQYESSQYTTTDSGHATARSSNSQSHQNTPNSASSASSSSFMMDSSSSSYDFSNSNQQGDSNGNSGASWQQQQYYNSNNSSSSNNNYYHHHHMDNSSTWNNSNYYHSSPASSISIQQEDHYTMPITPTYETNNHFLYRDNDHHNNNGDSSSIPHIDSYFQPQPHHQVVNDRSGFTVMVSSAAADPFHHSFESFYNHSKSCKNQRMI